MNFSYVALAFSCCLVLVSAIEDGLMKISPEQTSEMERKADLYYEYNKEERNQDVGPDFKRLHTMYPCIAGMQPIGADTDLDGHKFTCGIQNIVGAPIVYSFGSFGVQGFEGELLKVRPDAKIFIYEIMGEERLPPKEKRDPRITYIPIGLGGVKDEHFEIPQGSEVQSMRDLMKMNGHTYIDILKMDVEGFEFPWIKAEGDLILPNVGQFLVEVHIRRDNSMKFKMLHSMGLTRMKDDSVHFVEIAEKSGLRLFMKEPNVLNSYRCSELAFVQKSQSLWEKNKAQLKLN